MRCVYLTLQSRNWKEVVLGAVNKISQMKGAVRRNTPLSVQESDPPKQIGNINIRRIIST